MKEISFAWACCEMRKKILIMHSCVTRTSRAEASGSRFEVSLWHWEFREVLSWRHCRSSACFSPWFSFVRNWCDRFLATTRSKARRHSVFTCHFSQFLVLNWKHYSSHAQRRFLSRMEHQTLDKNSCHTRVYCSMTIDMTQCENLRQFQVFV